MSQFLLHGGRYRAEITQRGAALRVLRHGDRDLVTSWPADGPIPCYSGTILAPWPNRVAGARYSFGGQTHQLPVNEPDRGHALHGFVADVEWEVAELLTVEDERGFVRLTHRLLPTEGYPFELSLQVLHALDAEGLTTTVTATNTGEGPAPYGTGPHPWLLAGPRVQDYDLELPASKVLLVDELLLPTALEDVSGTPYDFGKPGRLGDTVIDHAYTALAADPDGRATVRVTGPEGGVEISWAAAELPWVQVCTGTGLGHAGLAVEPMTCPPDAFNSGTDLVVLQSGERHEVSWRIAAGRP